MFSLVGSYRAKVRRLKVISVPLCWRLLSTSANACVRESSWISSLLTVCVLACVWLAGCRLHSHAGGGRHQDAGVEQRGETCAPLHAGHSDLKKGKSSRKALTSRFKPAWTSFSPSGTWTWRCKTMWFAQSSRKGFGFASASLLLVWRPYFLPCACLGFPQLLPLSKRLWTALVSWPVTASQPVNAGIHSSTPSNPD